MSKSSRETILERIRRANEAAGVGVGGAGAAAERSASAAAGGGAGARADWAAPAGVGGAPLPPALSRAELVDLFVERAADYRAAVDRVQPADLRSRIESICAERGVETLVVPAGFPADLVPGNVEILPDSPALSVQALDAAGGVLTTCRLAIALTGTIVLDAGPGQGRRAATLVPDFHICIVNPEQIVPDLETAFTHLFADPDAAAHPLTFISGPSATSDIELSRVEGVHGPRTLSLLVTA